MHFKPEIRSSGRVCRFKYFDIDPRIATEEVVLDRVYLLAAAAAEFSSGIAAPVIPRGFFVIEKLFNGLANPLNRTLESANPPQHLSLSLSPFPHSL